jgi:hypothetical protein
VEAMGGRVGMRLRVLNYGGRGVDGCYAGGGRMGPAIQVGQAVSVPLGMRPVRSVAGIPVVEKALAVTGIVLVVLVLVARNADGQDRVSAGRGRAWPMVGRVVLLVVLAVVPGVVSVVVGAGVSCIAGLRCAGTEHAVMDWGSCMCLVFSAW